MSLVHNDLAVGRVHPKVADGLANPDVSVGVLDHCGAVDVADPHGAGARRDVGVADRPAHGDVTASGLELYRVSGLVNSDLADAGLEVAFPEATAAVERRYSCLTPHVRARRQVDLHSDRLASTTRGVLPPPLWCLDLQPAAGVLHASLLSGGHVGLLGTVARAHLDDGVGAVTCHDPDVTDPELHSHGDGFRSIEARHRSFLSVRFEGDAC